MDQRLRIIRIAKMRVSHPDEVKQTMPKPEPKPIECSEAGYMRQGNECVAVDCEQYEGNPCNDLIQPGNPNAAEEIIPVEEELPVEELPVEELPVEEEVGENTDDSEGDEDSGSDDSEGRNEESGGSDNEGSEESGGSEGETSE